MVWLLYLAVEPFVRRRWPQTIVSWSRILGGKLRDPLVGGDILIGVAFGLFWALLLLLRSSTIKRAAGRPTRWDRWALGMRFMAGGFRGATGRLRGLRVRLFLPDVPAAAGAAKAVAGGGRVRGDLRADQDPGQRRTLDGSGRAGGLCGSRVADLRYGIVPVIVSMLTADCLLNARSRSISRPGTSPARWWACCCSSGSPFTASARRWRASRSSSWSSGHLISWRSNACGSYLAGSRSSSG